MNVLIVHPCKGFYGGAEVVVSKLVEGLWKRDYKCRVVLKDAPSDWSLTDKRLRYVVNTHSWYDFAKEIRKSAEEADVINVHNFPASLIAGTLTHAPIVWYCNEPPEMFTNIQRKPIELFHRHLVRSSRMRVAVADVLNADRFCTMYHVEPEVIPYGIDYDFWSKEASIFIGNLSKLRMLQVGTITPYKNQLKSLVTLSYLTHLGVDASLTFIGSYPDKTYLLKLMSYRRIHNLEGRSTFVGQKTPEQVRDAFSSHDILLHPVKDQGGWLVPFEAMCAGLPVITHPLFTASSLIKDNNLGVVTADMGDIVARKKYREIDTAKASKWVQDTLTWDKYTDAMIKLFWEAHSERASYQLSKRSKRDSVQKRRTSRSFNTSDQQ
jgi:glycosyltransferase involved in cell wall biosynthesis